MNTESLIEKLQEEMHATVHMAAEPARGDGGLTYIDGLAKAISIAHESSCEICLLNPDMPDQEIRLHMGEMTAQ